MNLSLRGREAVLVLAFGTGPAAEGYITVSTGFLVAGLSSAGLVDATGSSLAVGLLLAGCCAGAPLLGMLADRYSLRTVSLCTIFATALLGAAVAAGGSLGLLAPVHFLLGAALGGDVSAGVALAGAIAGPGSRPRVLSAMMFSWYAGALAGVLAAAAVHFANLGWNVSYWPLAVIGVTGLLLRYGFNRGGGCAAGASRRMPAVRELCRNCGGALVFCCVFWLLQVIPATVMIFYAPMILQGVGGFTSRLLLVGLLYVFLSIGILPALFHRRMEKVAPAVFWTFAVMSAGLAAAAAWLDSVAVVAAAFGAYALAYGFQTGLNYVLPATLMPPCVRGTAMGVITAVSRMGAAMTAFALPFLIDRAGPAQVLAGGACTCLLGAMVAFFVPRTGVAGRRD